ncbi:MAG: cell division protein FtsA [Myxococcota bacterium]|jgi:cell division protein FtsA
MGNRTEIVAGLDFGSSKVAVVIMEIDGDRKDVIGVSMIPSGDGLRAGNVVAIDRTIEAVKTAVEEASRMADCDITSARLSVSGAGTMGFNSEGTVAVRGGRVTDTDVGRVLETAGAVKLPDDKQVLHTLPQEYNIDGQDGIKTPHGMTAVRLETRVHVITCSRTALTNAIECCNKAGLAVERATYSGLASSAAVLSDEERELGVVLVDIGGGTTDIAVWYDNALVHTTSLECGGDELTRQIARGLCTPGEAAERIKQRYGCAMASMIANGETMEVPGVGGREAQIRQRHLLCEILEPGLEDFFMRVQQEIEVAGCQEVMAAGIVLTGGTARLESIAELGMDVIVGMPVRTGIPSGLGGLHDVVDDPRYATAVGLCLADYDGLSGQTWSSTAARPKRQWMKPMRRIFDQWF